MSYFSLIKGLVEIPLRAAAASDPEGLATRPEFGPECDRARQRRSQCYAPVIAALAVLSDSTAAQPPSSSSAAQQATAAPSSGASTLRGPAGTVGVTAGAGPGGVGNGAKPLTAAERASYKTALLKVSGRKTLRGHD